MKSKLPLLLFSLGLLLLGVFIGRLLSYNPNLPNPPAPIPTATLSPPIAGAQTEQVLVSRVVDGDTIRISTGQSVRLIGIDAPEVTQVECFGREATQYLSNIILNQPVRLEKDVSETDRYGRLLRYIWLGDQLINESLVRDGYAHSSPYPPDVKYQSRFDLAENQARTMEAGLWSSCLVSPSPNIPNNPNNPNTFSETLGTSSDCLIKGNISSGGKIYHLPGCGSYEKTSIDESAGEHWFCTEEEAVNAGWRKAKNC